MRGVLVVMSCALVAVASDATAQGGEPRTVTTRVRHVSTIVLPATDTIVDVIVGDGEYWDVSASAHLAFIRPLMAGAESNLIILTATGAVIPLVVVERSDAPVDAVVQLGPADGLATAPVLAPVAAVAAAARDAAAAWDAVATAEATTATRMDAARLATQAELDAEREAYPRRLQFAYEFRDDVRGAPFLVEGMWHDGERTYLRTRATSPVLYEFVGDSGPLERVTDATVMSGVVYIVPRVLGPGVLDVGGDRVRWLAIPRDVGP